MFWTIQSTKEQLSGHHVCSRKAYIFSIQLIDFIIFVTFPSTGIKMHLSILSHTANSCAIIGIPCSLDVIVCHRWKTGGTYRSGSPYRSVGLTVSDFQFTAQSLNELYIIAQIGDEYIRHISSLLHSNVARIDLSFYHNYRIDVKRPVR